MATFNFAQNKASDTLYVLMSGISGGKDESFVQYLFDSLKQLGTAISIQFANDPLHHEASLPEMNALSMNDYFAAIDEAINIADKEQNFARVIFIAHSFSAIVATYYLHERRKKYALVTIDNDDSNAVLSYIDSLTEEAQRDNLQNPFGPSTTAYMRAHKSAEVYSALVVPKLHIDAREVGGGHEFTNEESRRLLMEKILAFH